MFNLPVRGTPSVESCYCSRSVFLSLFDQLHCGKICRSWQSMSKAAPRPWQLGSIYEPTPRNPLSKPTEPNQAHSSGLRQLAKSCCSFSWLRFVAIIDFNLYSWENWCVCRRRGIPPPPYFVADIFVTTKVLVKRGKYLYIFLFWETCRKFGFNHKQIANYCSCQRVYLLNNCFRV